MATKEAVGSHADGEYLHAAEIKNWRHAMGGGGVLDDTLTLTVTETNRVITVPAFTAQVPDGNGAIVVVSYAGGTVNVTASASNPRMDLLTLDSAGNLGMQDGVATAETGDVEEAPEPDLDDDEILIAAVRSPANQANVLAADIRGRAVQAIAVSSLDTVAQQFVESSGYKGFFKMPIAPYGGMVTATPYGDFLATIDAGTIISTENSANADTNRLYATGGGTNDVTLAGPGLYAANDFTLVGRSTIPSSSGQTIIVGAKTGPTTGADENNIIAFRVSGTGTVVGVCDSGGTETTRDSGATGATEFDWCIKVRSGGTIVRFYINGAQVGADVTTNIPTGLLYACAGIREAGSDRWFYMADMYGWREN